MTLADAKHPVVIKPDGTYDTITEPLTLERMQAAVGGYIELVTLERRPQDKGRVCLFVNEDGLRAGLPGNVIASALAKQPIVGNALLCVALNEGEEDEQYVGVGA
jgi:hypothetical protein